ncbi:MAG TPA: biopolymer transporter ExbD [Candidatus Binatia bacterium]|nr:biopolymer transporter ExbD [Candidatus Binatia bacterium]
MGMAVGGKKGVLADMNVVPLIDILLVLLIIFMVINPNKPKGLDALVPQPAPPNSQPNQQIEQKLVVVQVLNDGKLKINQEDSTWETLGPRLTDIFKSRAERVAFIKGDDNVPFENVARAIDIMHSSNIDHVGLMTAKVEAGQ